MTLSQRVARLYMAGIYEYTHRLRHHRYDGPDRTWAEQLQLLIDTLYLAVEMYDDRSAREAVGAVSRDLPALFAHAQNQDDIANEEDLLVALDATTAALMDADRIEHEVVTEVAVALEAVLSSGDLDEIPYSLNVTRIYEIPSPKGLDRRAVQKIVRAYRLQR